MARASADVTAYRDAPKVTGALVSVHRDQGLGCVLVALGAAIAGLGAWMLAMGAPAWEGGAYLALAVATVFGGRKFLASRTRVIELRDDGLVERHRGKVTEVRFDEVIGKRVDRVVRYRYGAVPVMRSERHTVETPDGRTITFGMFFEKATDLVAAVDARILPRLTTEALRAFDEGKRVEFGPLAVSEDGLHTGTGAPVPWSDLAGAAIVAKRTSGEEGTDFLEVRTKATGAPFVEVEVAQIPNATILLELIELAVEQASAAGT